MFSIDVFSKESDVPAELLSVIQSYYDGVLIAAYGVGISVLIQKWPSNYLHDPEIIITRLITDKYTADIFLSGNFNKEIEVIEVSEKDSYYEWLRSVDRTLFHAQHIFFKEDFPRHNWEDA